MNNASKDVDTWQDPIVAEVRAARQALFAAAGCDIREFCRRLRDKQALSGHQVVALARRTRLPKPEDAA